MRQEELKYLIGNWELNLDSMSAEHANKNFPHLNFPRKGDAILIGGCPEVSGIVEIRFLSDDVNCIQKYLNKILKPKNESKNRKSNLRHKKRTNNVNI